MNDKRGAKTKIALIEAGLELFGELGVEGTSTRMLSQHAGTNIAAINYHFGGKHELYLAVAEHICQMISAHLSPVVDKIVAQDLQHIDPLKAEQNCVDILLRLAEFFAEKREAYTASRIIMREQAKPTAVFTVFYENVMAPMQHTASLLIAKATGHNPETTLVKVQTHLFFGQALGLRVAREAFLRHLAKADLSAEELSTVYVAIEMQVRAGLTAMRESL